MSKAPLDFNVVLISFLCFSFACLPLSSSYCATMIHRAALSMPHEHKSQSQSRSRAESEPQPTSASAHSSTMVFMFTVETHRSRRTKLKATQCGEAKGRSGSVTFQLTACLSRAGIHVDTGTELDWKRDGAKNGEGWKLMRGSLEWWKVVKQYSLLKARMSGLPLSFNCQLSSRNIRTSAKTIRRM